MQGVANGLIISSSSFFWYRGPAGQAFKRSHSSPTHNTCTAGQWARWTTVRTLCCRAIHTPSTPQKIFCSLFLQTVQGPTLTNEGALQRGQESVNLTVKSWKRKTNATLLNTRQCHEEGKRQNKKAHCYEAVHIQSTSFRTVPGSAGSKKRVLPSEEYSAVRELSQTFLGLMRCGEGLLRAEARRS